MSLQSSIDRVAARSAELRHRLHQIPELGYEEFDTAAAIRAELSRLKIDFVAGVPGAPTATVAWIGDISKPCIALRADIDALPIEERTGLPYASARPGRMHACGHDGHTATLLGTADVLKAMERTLPVCVKFLFQPAEEGGGGAEKLVLAGALDGRLGPKVQRIFGLHGWPGLKVGTIAGKSGVLLAATDTFIVTFTGKGCHGAFPHLGHDPIVAAAEAVLSLQQIVSREVDPLESVVVTVGRISAGTAVNIIPNQARLEGTIRTLSAGTRSRVFQAVQRRCTGVAQANGCAARVDFTEGYPATINDPATADIVAQVARQTFGQHGYLPVPYPSMGGEDFAYYAEKIPACFFFLGVQPDDRDLYPPLHSDQYDFTDAAIAVGIRMFYALVTSDLCRSSG